MKCWTSGKSRIRKTSSLLATKFDRWKCFKIMARCLNCNTYFRPKRKDAVYCSTSCRVAYNRRIIRNKVVTDNSDKTILSLCDYSGAWSRPYREAGYTVIQIDLAIDNQDVRLLKKPDMPIHGILAAPPCTYFAISGARWKRTDNELRDGLSVVDACLRLKCACKPAWWALENPVGTLKYYLGEPQMYFQPCDYGDAYTKKTCLWGDFVAPKPTDRVEPIETAPGHHRIDAYMVHKHGTLGKSRQQYRSITPSGFAKAFFAMNP